jgi:hypothetical protein
MGETKVFAIEKLREGAAVALYKVGNAENLDLVFMGNKGYGTQWVGEYGAADLRKIAAMLEGAAELLERNKSLAGVEVHEGPVEHVELKGDA